MPSPWLAPPPGFGRRALLLGGLGLLTTAATGCTLADPRVNGATRRSRPTTSPSESERPSSRPAFAGAADAALREQALADLCAALLDGPRADDLDADQRRRLASVRNAHDRHAAALRSPEPTLRPGGPAPTRDKDAAGRLEDLSLPRSLALLGRREADVAERHRATAGATTGLAALLWGSLAVAAGAYGRTLDGEGPAVARAGVAVAVPVLTDVEAMQALVGQSHAMVYGHQLALGQLPVGSRSQRRGLAGLRAARVLRDQLTAALTRRSAPVPVPEPAYVPSTPVRDVATAGKLLRQMETALLPFCGVWLAAAATPADVERAVRALAATEERAAGWGAPPRVWPGWPDD